MWHDVTSTRASTTAVSCSVATSSSESLPNDGENPNQPKRLLFSKCDSGSNITMKRAQEHAFSLAFSRSGIHKSIWEVWLFWDTWWIL